MSAKVQPNVTVLSSNELNAKFKAKDFRFLKDLVRGHFRTNPADKTSATKFLNALAFHLYHNPLSDPDIAQDLVRLVALSLAALKESKLEKELADKVETSMSNIIFKGNNNFFTKTRIYLGFALDLTWIYLGFCLGFK